MRMLGAKVIVTPKAGKGTGMVEKAAELGEQASLASCRTRARHLTPAGLRDALRSREARVVPVVSAPPAEGSGVTPARESCDGRVRITHVLLLQSPVRDGSQLAGETCPPCAAKT